MIHKHPKPPLGVYLGSELHNKVDEQHISDKMTQSHISWKIDGDKLKNIFIRRRIQCFPSENVCQKYSQGLI